MRTKLVTDRQPTQPPRVVRLSKNEVIRLSLPNNHDNVKRMIYLNYPSYKFGPVLSGDNEVTMFDVIRASEMAGYTYGCILLKYPGSPEEGGDND